MKKLFRWSLAAVLTFVIGVCILAAYRVVTNQTTYQPEPEISDTEIKTKEPTFSDKVQSQFSYYDGRHRKLTKYIKAELIAHPDSWKHIETTFAADSASNEIFVRTRFSSKNDFGMRIEKQVVATVNAETGEVIQVISAN